MQVNELAPMPLGAIESVVFLGTPEVAAGVLSSLVSAGVRIEMAITREDAKRGRGGATTPSPVRQVADRAGIPVRFSAEDILDLPANRNRLGVVVAYGRIISAEVLSQVAMVNIHFSKLPRWRGAAPVERAILEGDRVTAADIMRVSFALDEGDVFHDLELAIRAEHTVASLRSELAELATQALINDLKHGFPQATPQVGEATYAKKIKKEELVIDWSQSAEHISRVVRIGGGSTSFRGTEVKIRGARVANEAPGAGPGSLTFDKTLRVACGSGWLEVVEIQPSGKKSMSAADWARGAHISDGEMFGAVKHG